MRQSIDPVIFGALPDAGMRLAPQPPDPPRSARMSYELGLTCAAMGDLAAAITALQDAVAQKPGLALAWLKLADLLGRQGDRAGAEAAQRAHAALPATAPDPSASRKAPSAGKRDAAERALRERIAGLPPGAAGQVLQDRLRLNPLDVSALRLLAEAALHRGQPDAAEALLARAIEIAPDFTAARHLYAVALFRQGKEAQALPHAEQIVAQDKQNIGYRTLLASCLATLGDVGRAASLYEAILKTAPGHDELWLTYGQALKHAGRRADAVQAFRHALSLAPHRGEAHWSLQNLMAGPADAADLTAMRAQLASGRLTPESRFHFHYALAYALEKSGDYAESFSHYEAGAKAWRAHLVYDADETTARAARAADFFTAARFAASAGAGCADPAPIFVLGMPRAGSTLIEQILASHSLVEGTQELPDIGHIVTEFDGAAGAPYPACLADMTADALAALGARYIARTRIYRRQGKPFFIDKMPANWVDIGLIQMILPHAKIIDARRDAMANCFAAFKKYFGIGQSFTYDLTELGRYYRDYAGLMDHFDAVLPGRIHRVQYETLVTDTEAEIHRLLAYCGLPFEPACLRFWETKRTVTTASSEQVRQPIFRSGLDQWRHYEPWLGPLKTALRLDAAAD